MSVSRHAGRDNLSFLAWLLDGTSTDQLSHLAFLQKGVNASQTTTTRLESPHVSSMQLGTPTRDSLISATKPDCQEWRPSVGPR